MLQRHYYAALCFTISILAVLPMRESQATTYRAVALSGQIAPGTAISIGEFDIFGSFSNVFGPPVLNNAGKTAFIAGFNRLGNIDSGIWSEGGGDLRLIAGEGTAAPGTSASMNYSSFTSRLDRIVLNDAGQTAFSATIAGDGRNGSGIWSEGGGSLHLVALEGSAAPGTSSDASFDQLSFTVPAFNNAGLVAFAVGLVGVDVNTENDSGIWSEGGGELRLIAREGSDAPGTGITFSSFGIHLPVLNDAGHSAFRGTVEGVGVGNGNWDRIWSESVSGLRLIAQAGVAAPGVSDGAILLAFEEVRINSTGQTAFRGILSRASVPTVADGGVIIEVGGSVDSGIWLDDHGSQRMIARKGTAAPGTESGVYFDFLGHPILNTTGQTAFRARLYGTGVNQTNEGGIWSDGDGGLRLVARDGDEAPGTGSGVVFRTLGFVLPTMNADGQTAFYAYLDGEGVDSTNDFGIWAEGSLGLELVARTGDLFEVTPGDLRVISGLNFVTDTGNDDGRRSGFNDRGQLAFFASFTDGSSGIFVADTRVVPEPASAALAVMAVCMLLLWRLRRVLTPHSQSASLTVYQAACRGC